MTQITWGTSGSLITSGSDASFGDDAIRSVLSNAAGGLGESFFWPGSATSQGASTASSGELKPGSLRFARSGSLSGGFPNGFLSVNTKNVSLAHIGSTWTGTVGHSAALYGQSTDTLNFPFPQTSRWLVQEGTFNVGVLTTSLSVTFPVSYKTTPVVFVLGSDPRQAPTSATTTGFVVLGVSSASTGGFTSVFSEMQLLGSSSSITGYSWRAEGIAAL